VEFVKQRRADLEKWFYGLIDMASHNGAKNPQSNAFYRNFLTQDANLPPLPLTRIYPEHIGIADAKETELMADPFKGVTGSNAHKVKDRKNKIHLLFLLLLLLLLCCC
jgi:hypothetical protein